MQENYFGQTFLQLFGITIILGLTTIQLSYEFRLYFILIYSYESRYVDLPWYALYFGEWRQSAKSFLKPDFFT